MSDVIQAVGPHKDKHGERCEVKHIDRRVAFGFDSDGDPAWWRCADGNWQGASDDYRLHIVGLWIDPPAFKPGDLVLVDCESSEHHQHYGSVETVTDHAPPAFGVRLMNGKLFCGWADTLKPVTLPAPLPAGYRLKPRNVLAVPGDIGTSRIHAPSWIEVSESRSWEGLTCESFDLRIPSSDPHFFAEPIPVPEPPTVDVGEGWRRVGEDEQILDTDEAAFERDVVASKGEWQGWVGAAIRAGDTPRLDNALRVQNYGPLLFRRRVPQPFRISDHGPGVYLTRNGREATVTGKRSVHAWHMWDGKFAYGDNGCIYSNNHESPYDLVQYLRPLPQPEWTPTDCYQQTTIVDGCEWTSRWYGKAPSAARIEQRWTNGTEEEWRPVPITTEGT